MTIDRSKKTSSGRLKTPAKRFSACFFASIISVTFQKCKVRAEIEPLNTPWFTVLLGITLS
jgi:hypothetical protein